MKINESSTDSIYTQNSIQISLKQAEDIFIKYHNENAFSQLEIV